jgi:hypothetical protein
MWMSVAVVCLVASSLAQASEPAVAGGVAGLEIAQQTELNPAVFVGVFRGNVDGKLAFGAWAAGVQHELPLPTESNPSVPIVGGQWQLEVVVVQGFRLRRVTLGGGIVGQLDFADGNKFAVAALMNLTKGGTGDIVLDATLDHNPFPPTILGTLSQ